MNYIKSLSLGQKRRLLTGIAVLAAMLVMSRIWWYYMDAPWTRDGKLRSDVIALAPEVSGTVTEVLVHDNQQIRSGDVLFRIDKDRLQLALKRADASVINSQVARDAALRESKRYGSLKSLVSEETRTFKQTQAEQALATYEQAVSDRDLAALNLARSDVKAPVDGIVTNFSLRPGAYVSAGVPVTAFVATDAFYVAGYFEENKLPGIHVGDPALVYVMGEKHPIRGKVESISAGIEDRERTTAGGTLLPNVNPTFNWVRLPQRIPVRIEITEVPAGLKLVSGRTATVEIGGN
ncbi:MAG: HlyD family secretion protein [Oligoflexia bacterium]|nr:HlyD family secretion protein [Oligoflexia bacterium]